MCYINSVHVSVAASILYKQQKKELNQLSEPLLVQPARRGFDYAPCPVIKPSLDGKDWVLASMEWGFIPSYLRNRDAVEKFRNGYKDATGKFHIGYTTLNVVGEKCWISPCSRKPCYTTGASFCRQDFMNTAIS